MAHHMSGAPLVSIPSIALFLVVVALNMLQMAKRIGPQREATKHEDLSGEECLTLDRVVNDD